MDLVTLRRQRADAYAAMEAAMQIADANERQAAFDKAEADVNRLDADINRLEAMQRLRSGGAVAPARETLEGAQPFLAAYAAMGANSHAVRPGQILSDAQTLAFGDFLLAVRRADRGLGMDERLVGAAAQGMNEGVPSEGGWLVEKDVASGLLRRTFDTARIANRARRIPISASANGIKIPALKDDSRATGARYGGIRAYWTPEAGDYTKSRPDLRMMKLELKKLTGLLYATDEMMQDAPALATIMAQAFPEEFAFMLDDAMFEGPGTDQPLGFMKAGCKVTVNAETGQTAGSIVYENITNMWARLPPRGMARAEWWINNDAMPQLQQLAMVIGTGGVPVYLPANGAAGSPYGTLFGRPVIPMEYCETVGTEGDIVLCDPTQYVLIDKGDIQFATSIHVAFLTGEQAFRFTYRVDGQPLDDKPITPFKGTNKLSNFITLATRS